MLSSAYFSFIAMKTQGVKEPFRATLSQRTKSQEPQRHDTKINALAVSAAPAELILLLPCIPRVSFRALPSLHPGLCRNVVPTALIVNLNLDTLALERQAYQKRAAAKNFATAP